MDWVGSYNIYYVCPATNGAWVDIRAQEPGLLDFLIDMATGDGAVDVGTSGSSGYNDLALVYKPDVKDNANLDFPSFDRWGYAVFGRVTKGMDVVDKIRKVPTTNFGRMQNVPRTPVVITKASTVNPAATSKE